MDDYFKIKVNERWWARLLIKFKQQHGSDYTPGLLRRTGEGIKQRCKLLNVTFAVLLRVHVMLG